MQDLIHKADVLLEALPYIQRFRNSTFVIKYGGSFMDSPDPKVRNGVAADVVFLEAVGINPVVVHGGGRAITRAMDAAGIKAKFVQGLRVTDEASVEIVERVLSHEINPEIVATIESLGGKARGFSGTEIFKCKKLLGVAAPAQGAAVPVDYGYVGEVIEVNIEPLRECIHRSITPVISPTARGEDGEVYNCNADTAAAQAAIALKARRLVFMSDVPGLLRDPKDPATLISSLKVGEVDGLKAAGVIDKGMIPKVDSGVEAIES
ncbi:MAG: acetylglutamate kinase, partial [Verrucomicrobia bacterium]|nr:acetylglutamate kinase [Verrucomicrobiota bacterium]